MALFFSLIFTGEIIIMATAKKIPAKKAARKVAQCTPVKDSAALPIAEIVAQSEPAKSAAMKAAHITVPTKKAPAKKVASSPAAKTITLAKVAKAPVKAKPTAVSDKEENLPMVVAPKTASKAPTVALDKVAVPKAPSKPKASSKSSKAAKKPEAAKPAEEPTVMGRPVSEMVTQYHRLANASLLDPDIKPGT